MNNAAVVGILVGGVVLGGTLGYAAGARQTSKARAPQSDAALVCSLGGEASNAQGHMVEVDGRKFTRDELPQDAQNAIFEAQQESYLRVSGILKDFSTRYLLAKERNPEVKPDALPSVNELLPAQNFTDEQLKTIYEANKSQLPPGTTFEQVKPQIERFLTQQAAGETVRGRFAEFDKAGRVKVLLTSPVAPVLDLKLDDYPSKGPSDAKVTLVEISDYLCGHCRTVLPEVEKVVQDNANTLRFIQVNMSLNASGLSGALIRGAFCVRKQSDELFWKYHHDAFSANQVKAGEEKAEVLRLVEASGADKGAAEKCLDSDEAKAFVTKTNETMEGIGVSSTPTFFLNGRKLTSPNLGEAVADAMKPAQ